MAHKKFEEENIVITYKDTFKYLWHYTKDKKLHVLAVIMFGMLAQFAVASTPVYTGQIVDSMIEGGDSAWGSIWRAFWLLIGIKAAYHFFTFITFYFNVKYGVKVMDELVTDAFCKVQRFSSEWHINSFGGSVVRKITRGQSAFRGIQQAFVLNIIPTFFLIVGIITMLSVKMPIVGLAMGVMTLIYIAISIFISANILARRYRVQVRKDNRISAVLGDAIITNQVVKSFGAEKQEDDNIISAVMSWSKYVTSLWIFSYFTVLVRNLLSLVMVAFVIGLVIWAWKLGNATPGDIALIITATSILSASIHGVGYTIAELQKSLNELDDVVKIWMREDEVRDVEDAVPLVLRKDFEKGKVVFDDVGFIYPQSDAGLFKGLSLKIEDGEHIALVGTSGSGKSTFIKLLQRLYNLNEGKIFIDGQDISQVTLKSLRQNISLVPQDPILFHRPLKENIAYGKPDATMEEIIEASKKANIYDFITSLPEGFDTEVGERGIKLSGGERQRVAIARAVLADKPMLVLDEATSSLDSVSELYIKEAMSELMKGKTTITVAHRLSTIKNSDRILVFKQGKIIEQGKHDELMANSKSQYRKLYDTQSLGIVIRDYAEEE